MMDGQFLALAQHLGITTQQVMDSFNTDDGMHFESHNETYLVLTDEQADERTREYIRESLWAFPPDFINCYTDSRADLTRSLKIIQEQCSEDCNELIYELVKNRFDDLVEDAIETDGRGHFLNMYDGQEYEENGFYIYQL